MRPDNEKGANGIRAPQGNSGVRRGIVVAAVLVLAGLAYISFSHLRKQAAATAQPQLPSSNDQATSTGNPVNAGSAIGAGSQPLPVRNALPPNSGSSPLSTATQVPVAPEMRQLVDNLVKPQTAAGTLTPEQVTAWKANLAQLVQQGSAAVPAIREFLDKNVDLDFGQAGRQTLGYGSARLALLDSLAQIGGPDALNAMSGILQTTADPREIAVLAKNFDQMDPSAHRQEILDAARATLAMAAEGKLNDRDVAPLFEVLQNYGDPSISEDLRKSAGKWNYYSMVALGQLPDGAGIPELVKIVQGEGSAASGARVPALEMLAQAAAQSDIARNALLDQAKQNALTPYNWATIESILAGDRIGYQDSAFDGSSSSRLSDVKRTHIASGNQNFYSAPPAQGLTADEVNAYSSLIDQLAAVTKDPSGLQVLERSRQLLARRSAQIAKSNSNQ